MKDIGIVTLYGNYNYGNKLQNYAVQTIFEGLGLSVVTINTEKDEYIADTKKMIKYFLSLFGIKRFENDKDFLLNVRREIIFKKFSSKYLKVKKFNSKNDCSIKDECSSFVTGSDQVWNDWNLPSENLNFYFLQFVEKNRRIAISPSFGVSFIKKNYEEIYRQGLNGFNLLSCREIQGKEIIQQYTDTECEVLLDPTMIVDKEHWEKILYPCALKPKNKYLLVYMLGTLDEDYKNYIIDIKERYKLDDVYLMDKRVKESFLIDPCQFLYLIQEAAIVLTDSFHATVFSIIFERPFLCFQRKGLEFAMESRIDGLLKQFNLENRKYGLCDINNLLTVNFLDSKQVLIKEKFKFYNYIRNALRLNGVKTNNA